jgi:hypothetical protein
MKEKIVDFQLGRIFFVHEILDGNRFLEQDEGGWICVIKGNNE